MDVLQMQTAFGRYLELKPEGSKVIATYIFIDYFGSICAKSKTLPMMPASINEVPKWSFGVADKVDDSDVTLVPVALFKDPFLRGCHKLVVCDAIRNGEPYGPNKRTACQRVMELCADQHVQIGMEQEYTMLDLEGRPYRWPKNGQPKVPLESLVYICGVGPDRAYGRALSDAHYLACLYAGIAICGTNAEATPSQWEYQVGPCEGVAIGDHMLAARYILLRCSEDFGIRVTFDPLPIEGQWTGTGCHVNVSTKATRSEGGLSAIYAAIEKLSKRVPEHLAAYDPRGGDDNKRRLAAGFFCPKLDKFSWGVADRSVTIRIPRHVADLGYGYFEDRRPASNCDPYGVARQMVETICLDQ